MARARIDLAALAAQVWGRGVWPVVHRPRPIAQSSYVYNPSALSAVLGVSGSEDGLVLWLCVAQPCTFSCILLPSVASLQRLSLFGR